MNRLAYKADLAKRVELEAAPDVDLDYHLSAAATLAEDGHWQNRLDVATSGRGKLSKSEFFYYQLYDPGIPTVDLGNFVGKTLQNELHKVCNSPLWLASVMDKALFELAMRGAGFKIAKTVANCTRRKTAGFANNLTSAADLREFLMNNNVPLFAKPIDGMYSIGCFTITDASKSSIIIDGQYSAPYHDVWDYFMNISASGYLLQSLLSHSGVMKQQFGSSICTTRLLVLYVDKPRIECCSIKIANKGAVADNFWRVGNLLAPVDQATGQMTHAFVKKEAGFSKVCVHPITKQKFSDMQLDNWSEACQMVLSAATLFPGIRTQSWDVALTSDGPVLMELNWGGDLNLHQLAHRSGALTKSFTNHINACGGGHLIP